MKTTVFTLFILLSLPVLGVDTALEPLTRAEREFTFRMVEAIAQSQGAETSFSTAPMTLFQPFTLLASGAKGETQKQLLNALHLEDTSPETLEKFQKLRELCNLPLEKTQVFNASRFYLDRMAPVRLNKDFQFQMKQNFGTTLELLDIQKSPESARGTINDWIRYQTFDQIQGAIPPQALDSDTAFVLAAAFYFESRWAKPFNPASTRPDDFFPPAGPALRLRFMQQETTFGYAETDDCQALFLPYAGEDYEMVILLPGDKSGLPGLREKLDVAFWKELLDLRGWKNVDVLLPLFKIESSYSLRPALESLGVRDLFSPQRSDLSGMAEAGQLCLQTAFTKTFLEVDESGTVAAAATAFGGMMGGLPENVVFRADHSFLYFIRDVHQDVILFAGQYVGK